MSALWVHFVQHHVQDMIVVLEEMNRPLPCCPKCDMVVIWIAFNKTHQATEICSRGGEIQLKYLRKE